MQNEIIVSRGEGGEEVEGINYCQALWDLGGRNVKLIKSTHQLSQ